MTSGPFSKSQGVSKETIGSWYQLHAPFVWKSLERLGVPAADVNDCAQRVFETALMRAATFQNEKPAKPWLFGIAFRVYVQHQREASRASVPLSEEAVAIPEGWAQDEALRVKQGWKRVQAFLNRLPLEQRAVFVMHELEEVAVTEVAAELGIPLNTAYSRLRLARTAFERFAAAGLRADEGSSS